MERLGVMGADTRDLKEFQKKLSKLGQKETEAFCQESLKYLAQRLLEELIKATPTSKNQYQNIDIGNGSEGERVVRNGGTLKRGWFAKSREEAQSGSGEPGAADIKTLLDSIVISKFEGGYEIEICNPVEYASYVEFGHRQTPGRYVPAIGKKLVNSWAGGKFFLKISEDELDKVAPRILEERLEKFLKEGLGW